MFTAGLINILLPQPAIAQEAKIDLILRLVGDYNYEVNAGKDNAFYLEIRNNGNQTVTNLRLSADKPEDWVIEFRPGVINYLGAGSVQTVDVNIKPSERRPRGNIRSSLLPRQMKYAG